MKNKLKLLILCLIPFFASADWLDINMPVGVTDISKEVFELHMLIFWVVVGIGVVVFGFLFWSMWKYRRSNNKKPANFTENHKLEIIWTIVPTVILILMAIPASMTLKKIYDHEADLMDSYTLGDIITILGVNARPGLEGKLDLVLTPYSKIIKKN